MGGKSTESKNLLHPIEMHLAESAFQPYFGVTVPLQAKVWNSNKSTKVAILACKCAENKSTHYAE